MLSPFLVLKGMSYLLIAVCHCCLLAAGIATMECAEGLRDIAQVCQFRATGLKCRHIQLAVG
jgi:ABC-type Mn2+/Zn2+ transport system permease subunit